MQANGAEPDRPIPDRIETSAGTIYRPQSSWIQIVIFIGAFFGGPAMGWLTGQALGGVSENAQTFLYVPYVLVFFMGYALWLSRLNALAFEFIGRGLLKALFMIVILRRKPEKLEDVLPTREKLEAMMARAQRAANSFWIVSIPIGTFAALASLLMETATGIVLRALLTGGGCLAWGLILGRLARRGYLPIPEDA
jgi:Ca2+/Na+ antiporter